MLGWMTGTFVRDKSLLASTTPYACSLLRFIVGLMWSLFLIKHPYIFEGNISRLLDTKRHQRDTKEIEREKKRKTSVSGGDRRE
jgi:hypothetical protein